MVKVNGKSFKIYTLDTPVTILERIAVLNRTLPHFISLKHGITGEDLDLTTLDSTTDILVVDLLDQIKKATEKSIALADIIGDIRKVIPNADILNTIIGPYITYIIPIYSSYGMDFSQIRTALVQNIEMTILNSAPDDPTNSIEFNEDIFNVIHKNKTKLAIDIQSLRAKVETRADLFSTYNDLAIVDSTEFEPERIFFQAKLNVVDYNLYDIFNSIRLIEKQVVFASFHTYFKIQSDFVPPAEWNTAIFEDQVIIKIVSPTKKGDGYITVSISLEAGVPVLNSKISTSDELTMQDVVFQTIQTLNIPEIKTYDLIQTFISGVFFVPNFSLYKFAMTDMAMNDPLISYLIGIDERNKASKDKLYLVANSKETGKITSMITPLKAIKNSPYLKGKDPSIFPIGQNYLRISIVRANDSNSVNKYKIMLGKLLTRYSEMKDNVSDYYLEFIPDLIKVDEEPPPPPSKKALRFLEPQIFTSEYGRMCQKYPPTIVDDDVIVPEGIETHWFPKNNDIVPMKKYACLDPNAIYFGLKKNITATKDKFPAIPCCYSIPRTDSVLFRQYYFDEIPLGFKGKQIITTNKFTHEATGVLPVSLNRYFNLYLTNTDQTFMRTGVALSPNSFIGCLFRAFNPSQTTFSEETYQTFRDDLVNTTGSDAIYPTVCKQEMYNYTLRDLTEYIKDGKRYFDPNLLYRLLEEKFKCNIFVFRRHEGGINMVLPTHVSPYYRYIKYNNSVYIYEHLGTESHATWQCELIYKEKISTNGEIVSRTYLFNDIQSEEDAPISVGIINTYHKLNTTYVFNTVVNTSQYLYFDDTIVGQTIDSFGKTRGLLFKDKKPSHPTIYIITSPLQPYNIPVIEFTTIPLARIDSALAFAKRHNVHIIAQTIYNGQVKELTGMKDGRYIYFPVKAIDPYPSIRVIQGDLHYMSSDVSALSIYEYNKRLSKFIVEYTKWLYSRHLNGKKIDLNEIDINYICTIDPTVSYNGIQQMTNILTLINNPIIRDGKLIVKNANVVFRLKYMLRLYATRDPKGLLTYKDKIFMDNYYNDLNDFTQYQTQVILKGNNSILKWINERVGNYIIHSELQTNTKTPWFFLNELVLQGRLCLVQPVENMTEAINVAYYWQIHKENKKYVNFVPDDAKINVYAYTSPTGIQLVDEYDKDTPSILAYRVLNDMNIPSIEYMALLPIYHQ